MKYKFIGMLSVLFCACAITGILCLTEQKNRERYHQHLEQGGYVPCETHDDTVFCSHLPLIAVYTNGEKIPGETVYDENGGLSGYTTTESGETYLTVDIEIRDREGGNHHLFDEASLASKGQIRIRGRSSREFDKKSFALILVNEDLSNNPQRVMGMDSHHEWILHGPFLDKSLIRNYMWYNIAGEIMSYSPNVRFCELFLDGEYQGLYVLTESITAGKEGTRLSLSVDKKNNTFTGYLLRLDDYKNFDDQSDLINNFSAYTYYSDHRMEIKYPGKDNLTPQISEAIRQDFSNFEKALYSYDYDTRKYGYRNAVNIDSFADYFIINELTCNYDAGSLSTYLYKDIGGKYSLCIWDFNNACDNYMERPMPTDDFYLQYKLWFNMLCRDEYFTDRIIQRYRQLRKTFLNDDYLERYINDTIEFLGPAIARNFQKWGYTFEEEHNLLRGENRQIASFEEAVTQLKAFLRKRGSWLDENIGAVSQYSAESAVKKYNENVK